MQTNNNDAAFGLRQFISPWDWNMYLKEVWEEYIMTKVATYSDMLEFEKHVSIGHVRAIKAAVRKAQRFETISLWDFLDWHSWMFPKGGELRQCIAEISGSDVVLTHPSEIRTELHIWCNSTNELCQAPSKATMKDVAWRHLWFEKIHPVTDGNGRIGRIGLNYTTVRLRMGFICIDPKYRNVYLDALRREDINALAQLFQRSQYN